MDLIEQARTFESGMLRAIDEAARFADLIGEAERAGNHKLRDAHHADLRHSVALAAQRAAIATALRNMAADAFNEEDGLPPTHVHSEGEDDGDPARKPVTPGMPGHPVPLASGGFGMYDGAGFPQRHCTVWAPWIGQPILHSSVWWDAGAAAYRGDSIGLHMTGWRVVVAAGRDRPAAVALDGRALVTVAIP